MQSTQQPVKYLLLITLSLYYLNAVFIVDSLPDVRTVVVSVMLRVTQKVNNLRGTLQRLTNVNPKILRGRVLAVRRSGGGRRLDGVSLGREGEGRFGRLDGAELRGGFILWGSERIRERIRERGTQRVLLQERHKNIDPSCR